MSAYVTTLPLGMREVSAQTFWLNVIPLVIRPALISDSNMGLPPGFTVFADHRRARMVVGGRNRRVVVLAHAGCRFTAIVAAPDASRCAEAIRHRGLAGASCR